MPALTRAPCVRSRRADTQAADNLEMGLGIGDYIDLNVEASSLEVADLDYLDLLRNSWLDAIQDLENEAADDSADFDSNAVARDLKKAQMLS